MELRRRARWARVAIQVACGGHFQAAWLALRVVFHSPKMVRAFSEPFEEIAILMKEAD